MSTINAIKPIGELNIKLQELIIKEINNKDFRKNILETYTKKGLNLNTVACLLNETKLVTDLDDIEKIALANATYETFKRDKLNPASYFSGKDLAKYETYMNVEEKTNEIHIDEVQRIDDFNYRTTVRYKDVYEWFKNMLILYNKETQRATTLKKLGNNGIWVRQQTVDNKAVKEITKAMLEGTFEESEIILNVRLIENKTPNFIFDAKYKNIGEVVIKPNYIDINDPEYTVVEILDGYHRILAIQSAMEEYKNKNDEWLEGNIGVKIVLADYNRALRIVAQTFKRSDTNQQFLKSIEESDYSKFVDNIIRSSSTLKNKVGNMYEECEAFDMLTYKSILIDAVKKLNIEVNNIMVKNFTAKKIAIAIDEFMELTQSEDNILYRNPHLFAGYISYFYNRIKNNIDIGLEEYEELMIRIKNIKNEDIKKMKLSHKYCNLNQILNYF